MDQKQAIADRLKQANNILVTVSNNPSVDQLSSCIGLTLALNKLGKHATAVFSGAVPSTIEFLQPEKTIEKNTDSLRDFIIALDKAKADKLRYKVEDKVVKIFITPYKTSITEKDLDFSQGDFNVDLVLALGVHQQADLDQAITSHGRILHDAAVATLNTKPGGELGSMNWVDPGASSLSELTVQLLDQIDKSAMDGQMATAFLTGIVAETDRFSNEKTTPTTMSISAELMGAGANQQLVATKLEAPAPPPPPPPPPPAPLHQQGGESQPEPPKETHTTQDGTLEIAHDAHEVPSPTAAPQSSPPPPPPPVAEPEPENESEPAEPPMPQIHIDEHGALRNMEHDEDKLPPLPPVGGPSVDPTQHMASSHMFLQPPAGGEPVTPGVLPEDTSSGDPLSLPPPESPFGTSFGAGVQPQASATIAAPEVPYMPASMRPGAAPASPTSPPPLPTPSFSPVPPPPPPPAPPVFTPPAPVPPPLPSPLAPPPPAPGGETLSQIEADVNSPHVQTVGGDNLALESTPPVLAPNNIAPPIIPPAPQSPPPPPPSLPPAPTPVPPPAPEPPVAAVPDAPDLDSARQAVMQAIAAQPQIAGDNQEPIKALNAQPLGSPLHDSNGGIPAGPPPSLDPTTNPTFTLPDAPNNNADGQTPPAMPPPMMPPASPVQ